MPSFIVQAILSAAGHKDEEFLAFHSEGGMVFLGDICLPGSQFQAKLLHTLQGSYYSCLHRSSIISKCVCLGRTVTFACFPSLVKWLRWDSSLFQSKTQQRGCVHVCSFLLLTCWASQRCWFMLFSLLRY